MELKIVNQKNITIKIFDNSQLGCEYVAGRIRNLIVRNNGLYKTTVLGLATGNTPTGVYKELVNYHKRERLSYSRVVTFNLDEYYPMNRYHEHSYHTYMHHHLFNETDIHPDFTFIPNGELSASEITEYCNQYEEQIERMGAIDIQLLGIGENGHIGFNEPGAEIDSLTRKVKLALKTRENAAQNFGGIKKVPQEAITMGVNSILKANEIICMAWGKRKAKVIADFLHKDISIERPVSYLHTHANVKLVIDEAAASFL